MKAKHKRLSFVIAGLALLGVAAALVFNALDENLLYFHSPTDISERNPQPGQRLRLGGLVEEGTIVRDASTQSVTFSVTDGGEAIEVVYVGILPDLFREGQGVIADGALNTRGQFEATEVLAKHDENYMPKEVKEALEERGEWRPGEGHKS